MKILIVSMTVTSMLSSSAAVTAQCYGCSGGTVGISAGTPLPCGGYSTSSTGSSIASPPTYVSSVAPCNPGSAGSTGSGTGTGSGSQPAPAATAVRPTVPLSVKPQVKPCIQPCK